MIRGFHPSSRLGWIIFFGACFCAAMLPAQADPDLWGHVRFGLDAIESRGVAWVDPYSYQTQGHPWINHEWLSEVLFAACWKLAGASGLIFAKFCVVLAISALIYRHLLRAGWGEMSAGLALLFFVWPLAPGLLVVRPHLFTCLGFLVILLALEGDSGPERPWVLPLVILFWANLHGGVIAGLGWLAAWLALRWCSSLARTLREWVAPPRALANVTAVASLCALATLANPYGWELPAFLLRESWQPRPEIAEWNPVDVRTAAGSSYLALVLAAIGAAGGPAAGGWARKGLLAIAGLLPLLAMRHLPLFALAVAVLGARPLAIRWAPAIAALGKIAGRLPVPPAGLAAAGVALLLIRAISEGGAIPCARPGAFEVPARAVELLERSGASGGIAIHFDWGEYAIWHLGPRVRVAIDGRRETAYPRAAYDRSLRFLKGGERWDELLEDPETVLALVPRGWPCSPLLGLSPGWELVHADRTCALFARRGSAAAARLGGVRAPEVPDDGDGLRFPGP